MWVVGYMLWVDFVRDMTKEVKNIFNFFGYDWEINSALNG